MAGSSAHPPAERRPDLVAGHSPSEDASAVGCSLADARPGPTGEPAGGTPATLDAMEVPVTRTLLLSAALVLAGCSDGSPDPVSTAQLSDGPVVSYASVHLKGGKTSEPKFFDGGLTLNESGDVSGLGGGDIFVGLLAHANAFATCTNPGTGQHQPAGQNPAPVTISGGVAIPASEIKNGNLHFSVTTLEPPHNPRAAVKGECPGVQWTYEVTDLAFTDGTMTIQQPKDIANPSANIVLSLLCTLSPATANGSVAALDVTC